MREEPHNLSEQAGSRDSQEVPLERDLSAALRPLRLPDGFADRLVARAGGDAVSQRRPGAKVLPFRVWRLVSGGLIAATLAGGIFAARDLREQHEREKRQALATRQFETATRITDEVLAHTREELERSGALRGD